MQRRRTGISLLAVADVVTIPGHLTKLAASSMWAARLAKVWDLFTESRSQVLVILLFRENVADLFRHSKLTYSFALTNPLAIVSESFHSHAPPREYGNEVAG